MAIIDLKDIEYLDIGINKKTVFDNEQSSLTLLAFKKDAQRSLHIDKADEVAQIIEGEAIITIGTTKHHLKEGQMIVMPMETAHGLYALTDVKMLLLRPKHIH